MSANPYENEPGFENARSSDDKKNIAHYIAKVYLAPSHFGIAKVRTYPRSDMKR